MEPEDIIYMDNDSLASVKVMRRMRIMKYG
jgi:hypothetical protein